MTFVVAVDKARPVGTLTCLGDKYPLGRLG